MDEKQEKEVMNENNEPEVTNVEENAIENIEVPEEEKESAELEETTNTELNDTAENNVQEESVQEEAIVEVKKKKGNYITGTIGAILGGAVASIPWILTYSFANMIVAVLATIIAGGAYLGYKIFKGKIGRGFPAILTIVSLLIVTIVTTVICPTILMAKSGYPITLDNLLGLYSDLRTDVRTAIFEDLAISLLFTIIGIGAIVHSLRLQIKEGADEKKIRFSTQAIYEQAKKQLTEQSEVVKNACKTLGCMNKENTTTKQELLNELEMTYNVERKKAKKYFAACTAYKLLKKHKGKYYYDETDEQSKIEKAGAANARRVSPKVSIIIIIVAIIIGAVAGYLISNTDTQYFIPNSNIELEITDSQILYGTPREIKEAFDEQSAIYYDFIIKDGEADKYDIYGQLINKTTYEGYDFDTIMQLDRDYYAALIGEENTSEVSDKSFENKSIKSYNYTYTGNDGNQYKAVIYLYDVDTQYLWINVYMDSDVEYTQVDTMIDNLLK